MSERGPEGEPREGERTEVKVKTPQARAFVRDQGFAGVGDGGGHALKAAHQSRATRTLQLEIRPLWRQVPQRGTGCSGHHGSTSESVSLFSALLLIFSSVPPLSVSCIGGLLLSALY